MKIYSSYICATSLWLLEDDFYLKTGKISTELSLSSDKVNALKGFYCQIISEALMQRREENGYHVFSCLFISFAMKLWQLSGNLPLGKAYLTTFQMFHQNMSNSSDFPTEPRIQETFLGKVCFINSWLGESFLHGHSPWQAPAILVTWGVQGALSSAVHAVPSSPEHLSFPCSFWSSQATGHMAEILVEEQLRFE